jgi:hypothetical protein
MAYSGHAALLQEGPQQRSYVPSSDGTQKTSSRDRRFQADQPYYDVIASGEQFVMLLYPRSASPTHYNLVVNWFEEVRQRMR